MRASLLFIALVAALFCVGFVSANDPCNAITSCSACIANSTLKCGWCSDWNGCMAGSWNGPSGGQTCSSWHPDSCVGVSIPRVSSCQGGPITPIRIRQLMRGGGNNYNITASASWTMQSRSCNPVTGCTNWAVVGSNTAPAVRVSLQTVDTNVFLSVVTGNCIYNYNYCYNTYLIPYYNSNQPRYGVYSKDVGQNALTFNYNAIPKVACTSSSCQASPWAAPDGTNQWTLKGELTDNCLHISSAFTDASTSFVELFVTF